MKDIFKLVDQKLQALREAEEQPKEDNKEATSVKFDVQTSFPKDEATAKAAVAQLQSGDPNASIFKAMEKTDKNKDTGEETVVKVDPAKAKEWVEKIGPDVIVQRIKAVADKIPSSGLSKKDMPFLPGPPDAKGDPKDVEDALTPGGKYNVDFKEAVELPAPNEFTSVDTDPKAKDFMTSGEKDGNKDDDKATVKVPASVAASQAIPTQTNILLGKSLAMAIGGVKGGDLDAWISTKGEILDGHHRWAATMLNDPSATLGAAGAIDMDAMGGREKALKYLTGIGNALGNPTKVKENIQEVNRWQKLAGIIK